jgi:hypothetical protein
MELLLDPEVVCTGIVNPVAFARSFAKMVATVLISSFLSGTTIRVELLRSNETEVFSSETGCGMIAIELSDWAKTNKHTKHKENNSSVFFMTDR